MRSKFIENLEEKNKYLFFKLFFIFNKGNFEIKNIN